jgi:hypothetical protein
MNALEWSELIKNIVSILAVIAGGMWAFWKWGYSDWAGAQKNRPSLDGHLTIDAASVNDQQLLVTVVGHWNNRGHFPVVLDSDLSRVQVFELPDQLTAGAFELSKHLKKPLFIQHPFSDLQWLELEPQTQSTLRAHFVLQPRKRYFIRWEFFKKKKNENEEQFLWSKEIAWEATSNNSLQPTPAIGRG